ncbi:MAG: hypothetical protein GDA50_07795 [Alphaproteobacteria bacterium GM202ARS2]|nr:hypothetical protein [Alphaproteobacteria bacterium GM202ARS2]
MQYVLMGVTVLLAVASQLMAKVGMRAYRDAVPEGAWNKLTFYVTTLLADPYILASYTLGLLASLFWLLTLSRMALSHAYVFVVSSTIVLVVLSSSVLLREALTLYKVIGVGLVVIGLLVMAQDVAS